MIRTKLRKIFTVRDALMEKHLAELPSIARAEAEIAERKRIADILAANPEIGELCQKGKRMFYVWPAGGEYRQDADPTKLVGLTAVAA